MALKTEIIFSGNGVSPGVALGQALKLDSHNRMILKIRVDDVEAEAARYLRAVEAARAQMETLRVQLEKKVGSEHGVILDAHLLILEDRTLTAEIIETIRENHANAEWAVIQATDRLVHAYQSLKDEYFRERHSDIEQVAERILLNLSGDRPIRWEDLPDDLIIVSRDFNPSNFATMDLQKVRGLALESGGRTSHTAIISRGLLLPAVMGIRELLPSVSTGDMVLLNGDEGLIVVNPTPETIARMKVRMEAFELRIQSAAAAQGSQTFTPDGTAISLRANTELPSELRTAIACGAEGIGLFRSEFLYFSHPNGFPGMAEQLETYRMMVREMRPHSVAIRTLDAGSEKTGENADLSIQPNPSMGLRGIRLSLHLKESFRSQVEAILMASMEGSIEIVLPMISSIEEIWEAGAIIADVKAMLQKETGARLNNVPLGAMVEVPSAVLLLERIAKEVDFLCVGTNDLIQYTLAVDRGNPQVAYLFQPLHPSVLYSLNRIAEVARLLKKPVRICGEISSNPFIAVLLLGMGFTELSMNPLSIPPIRKALREVPLEAATEIAKKAMTFDTSHEVHKYLTRAVQKLINWDIGSYATEIEAGSSDPRLIF